MNEKCHLRPKLRDASSGEIAGEMMLGGINPARFVGPISYIPTIFKSGNKYNKLKTTMFCLKIYKNPWKIAV